MARLRMPMLDYVVRMSTDDAQVRDAYVAWLRDGHVAAVVTAGAVDGRVVVEDGGPPYVVETRYTFASRASFAAYERDHAPPLREEGKRLFAHVAQTRRLGDRLL